MAKLKFKNFREVVDLWTTRTLLAYRLSLPVNTVVRWRHADSVPPQYWRALCALSRGRVTIDNLLDLAEAKAKRLPKINMEPRKKDFAA